MYEEILNCYPGWRTVRRLGTGSFGSVYEIERELFGRTEKAALKIISVPKDPEEVEELYTAGYDAQSVSAYYQNLLENIVREYQIMVEMKGNSNVVSCEDIQYYPRQDGVGWIICIKMELLTPMLRAMDQLQTEEQICKFGEDLCKALVLCHSRSVIHRDIKPQNIFISKDGDYKLGDFGIAKITNEVSRGTRVGTMNYIAPEIYCDLPYGHRADLYSLGLVMYWLLNERRLPFVALPPANPSSMEIQDACLTRLHGGALPPPVNGSPALHRIILKACAYNPNERYASAQEMLLDLQSFRGLWLDPLMSVPTAADSFPAETGLKDGAEETVLLPCQEPAADQAVVQPAQPEAASVRSSAQPDFPEDLLQPKTVDYETVPGYDAVSAAEETRDGSEATNEAPVRTGRMKWIAAILAAAAVAAVALAVWKPWDKGPRPDSNATRQESAQASPAAEVPTAPLPSAQMGSAPVEETPETPTTQTLSSAQETEPAELPFEVQPMIFAGGTHTAGLRADGTLLETGGEDVSSLGRVDSWNRIVDFACTDSRLFGLRDDGIVQGVGWYSPDYFSLSSWQEPWSGIVDIAANDCVVIGLRADGTAVISGDASNGERAAEDWKDITAISCGCFNVYGLREDGTAVACGYDGDGLNEKVESWSDLVAVVGGAYFAAGLHSDGTVSITAESGDYLGLSKAAKWRNIVAIAAGDFHLVGLHADGTVVAVGRNEEGECSVKKWTDIVAIAAGYHHTVGLQADGTVVATGEEEAGACKVDGWKLQ